MAIKVGAVAIPLASVTAVEILEFVLTKVPLAPLVGAVKVTSIPASGSPSKFRTDTFNGLSNAARTCADWGEPLLIESEVGDVVAMSITFIPL